MTISSINIIKKITLIILVIGGLYYAKQFFMPLFLGALIATLFLPLCNWMEKKGIHKGIATLSCFLIIVLAMGLIALMISWQISEIVQDITLIKEGISSKLKEFQQYIFDQFGISANTQWQMVKDQQDTIANILQLIAGSLASILSNLLLILVYFFLFLYYRNHLKQFILKFASQANKSELERIVGRCTNVTQQYLVGMAKMILCLWIMYGIGFSLLGVKNALFFAVLCGLLEIVPFIGNITGTTITVLVSLVNGAPLPVIGGIIAVYAFVQLFQGWILEPLILGPQVKINPLFTIVALILGELIWGIPGIVLAIPFTAITKIICDNIDSLKPYGFLIGELEEKKKESKFLGFVKKLTKIK